MLGVGAGEDVGRMWGGYVRICEDVRCGMWGRRCGEHGVVVGMRRCWLGHELEGGGWK